ncbi:hypothetical protein DMENIID0001_065190 [Sergentomyia squamirostris]
MSPITIFYLSNESGSCCENQELNVESLILEGKCLMRMLIFIFCTPGVTLAKDVAAPLDESGKASVVFDMCVVAKSCRLLIAQAISIQQCAMREKETGITAPAKLGAPSAGSIDMIPSLVFSKPSDFQSGLMVWAPSWLMTDVREIARADISPRKHAMWGCPHFYRLMVECTAQLQKCWS